MPVAVSTRSLLIAGVGAALVGAAAPPASPPAAPASRLAAPAVGLASVTTPIEVAIKNAYNAVEPWAAYGADLIQYALDIIPGLWLLAPGVDLAYYTAEPLVRAGVYVVADVIGLDFAQIEADIRTGLNNSANNAVTYAVAWFNSIVPLPPLPPLPGASTPAGSAGARAAAAEAPSRPGVRVLAAPAAAPAVGGEPRAQNSATGRAASGQAEDAPASETSEAAQAPATAAAPDAEAPDTETQAVEAESPAPDTESPVAEAAAAEAEAAEAEAAEAAEAPAVQTPASADTASAPDAAMGAAPHSSPRAQRPGRTGRSGG